MITTTEILMKPVVLNVVNNENGKHDILTLMHQISQNCNVLINVSLYQFMSQLRYQLLLLLL